MNTFLEDRLFEDEKVREVIQENATLFLGELIENLEEDDFEVFRNAQQAGAKTVWQGDTTAIGQLEHYLEKENDNLKTEEARDLAGLGFVLGFSLEKHLDRGESV